MSTFGIFILVVAAFFGTVMFITDPRQKLLKWSKGKKQSQMTAEAEKAWDENAGDLVLKGCGYVLYLFFSFVLGNIVEPLAVIAALTGKIGFQPLAYAMLAIIAIKWLWAAKVLLTSKKKSVATVQTPDGEKIKGTVVSDEVIKLGNPVWSFAKRFFFFLPTLYLWYMFLVVIGIL